MRSYYSGYVMSQSADQDGIKQEKYSQIFALLSENEQGRHFIDALSSESKSGQDPSLRSRIFALERQLASQGAHDGFSAEQRAACQNILADIFQAIEQEEARRKEQNASLQQICKSLQTTASQLKGSGDHSIAGHILSDMVMRLTDIRKQNSSRYAPDGQIVGSLTQLQEYLGKCSAGNASVNVRKAKKTKRKKFI